MEQFRRTDPRYARRLEVELSVEGKSVHTTSRNLSLGGIFVEYDEALPLNTTVQLKFRIPTQPEPIEVGGDVRWVDKAGGRIGIGIRFHGLRARDVWALNRFFQT